MSPRTTGSLNRLTGGHPALSGSHAALTRRPTQAGIVMLDFVIVMAAAMAAYITRFEGAIPATYFKQLSVFIPLLAIARVVANRVFGVYRMVWRYVGLGEVLRFVQAVATVSALLLVARLIVGHRVLFLNFPYSIIVLEGALTFLVMAGARFVPRILAERTRPDVGTPTLVIGAGQGGLAVVKEAARHPELDLRPIGFLDDDPTKTGMEIGALRVLGTVRDIDKTLKHTGAERVIIASAAIHPKAIARVMDVCNPLGVDVRIVKGTYEHLDPAGAATAAGEPPAMMREVRIEDLLSRDPVPPSLSLDDLRRHYGGKRVLVTGAGGSIGAELCRQLALMSPGKLYLAERDETNLFEIERELAGLKNASAVITPVLLDVMDGKQVEKAFRDLQPQIVFHAAAYKHVPMMERFPWEAVRNNVFATKQLAELADEHGVESFVMISTDKAINPTSVMGATKRFAEQVVQEIAPRSKTRFSCVRFGNVLGSRGSVVGIFRDQIAKGGPVTVTHPEATRYFMTIPEAANLVLQAGTIGANGEVFLLDMGEPVKIIDLARQMIRLSGFTEAEIPVKVIGTRPGEKLFEELSSTAENLSPTELRKILRCRPVPLDAARLGQHLERLAFLVKGRDADGVRQVLRELEIGYEVTPARHA